MIVLVHFRFFSGHSRFASDSSACCSIHFGAEAAEQHRRSSRSATRCQIQLPQNAPLTRTKVLRTDWARAVGSMLLDPAALHTSQRGGAKTPELCSPSPGAQLELLSLWVGAYLPAHLKRTAEVRAQKAAGRTSRRMSSLSYKVELAGVLVP